MEKRECKDCAHWKQRSEDDGKYGVCDVKNKLVRDSNHCPRWDTTLVWSVS